MTYQEATGWLFAQRRQGERGLGRVRVLLERLGHPEEAFQAVHVLGTNGKGSVVAYLEAAFRAAGMPYGAYTSPHLLDFRERIRTHLGLILEEEVVEFVAWARGEAWPDTTPPWLAPGWGLRKGPPVGGISLGLRERNKRKGYEPPGFFDLATALAFQHFQKRGVALAAVEAGVGGEKDATNILPRVALTVLTNVGEDHLEALGGSLEAVAWEKAGALRKGVPVVTGAKEVGLKVVQEVARIRGSPLYVLDPKDPLFALPTPPGLKGAFQEENARLAAAALRLLGFPEEAIAQGLREARHPGRLERFLLEGVEVFLDGAHNPPAALVLSREFSAYHLVYGAFPRKDVKGVLAHLLPKAKSVRYTRAGEGALGRELGEPFFEDPGEALTHALERAREDGLPILATGSLYLVGALRARLLPGFGQNLP